MIQTSCIPDDRLRSLLLGELPDEAAAPLEDHLLDCPQCLDRTRSLKSADTLVAALQGADGGELSAEQSSSVQRLVQRLSDRSQLATHSSLLDATAAPGSNQDLVVQQIVARLEPAAKPDELGRLGSFRVLKLLGHGGMGAVFLAEDVQLRRHVALKLLRPNLISDREAVERFMREARAAAAVRHDHVVTIFQVGEVNGVPFLAQELLEGETLDDRLRREEKLPIDDALRIGREIAAGLSAAHARGLLHRDIKPSNIWLEHRSPGRPLCGSAPREEIISRSEMPTMSRVKLLDFGLARIESDDVQLTQSGVIVGTPAFMSPEQAQGKAIDFRSDLFSLGCVLYRMVTGRLPFQGTDTLSMLHSLAVDVPPASRKLNPQIPSELSDFIAKLLHKDPLQRPWSAENVASRLAAIASTWGGPPAGQSSPSLISRSIAGHFSRTPRRQAIALGIAGILAVVAGIIITITRPDGTKTKIEVDGDAKVEVATDSSKPKATAAATSDQVKTVSDTPTPKLENQNPQSAWSGWPKDAPPPAIAPFDAEQAKAHQEAWGKHLGVPVEYVNSIGMKFRLIPPGEFLMGMTAEQISDLRALIGDIPNRLEFAAAHGPQHRAILTRPFFIGVHEVTQNEFERVTQSNPSYFSAGGAGKGKVSGHDTAAHPVEMVSWDEAVRFCAKLSQTEHFSTSYGPSTATPTELNHGGYRLPTNAEWEFACRGGTATKFSTGDAETDLSRTGWYSFNTDGRTHAACELASNPFGLFDMHGNVWEWCHDPWDPNFYSLFSQHPAIDPVATMATDRRVRRGGCFDNAYLFCNSASRYGEFTSQRSQRTGFRAVLPVNAVLLAVGNAKSAVNVGETSKPVYENDFSDPSVYRQTAEDKARNIFAIRNGQLIIQVPNGSSGTFSSSVSYPMTSANFEIIGRASKGLWGFNIKKTPEINYWLQVVLDQQGKLKTGVIVIDRDRGLIDLPLIPVVQKPVATWKGDGAFNTLRGTVRDGLVRVWINGEEACEPIKLPDQFQRLQIFVAASATDDQGAYAEFDSVRVWRAGEAPPLLTEDKSVNP